MINIPIPSHPDPPSTTSALNSYWFFTNCSIWIYSRLFFDWRSRRKHRKWNAWGYWMDLGDWPLWCEHFHLIICLISFMFLDINCSGQSTEIPLFCFAKTVCLVSINSKYSEKYEINIKNIFDWIANCDQNEMPASESHALVESFLALFSRVIKLS